MKKLLVLLMFFPGFFKGQIKDTDSMKISYNNKGNSFARENKFQKAIIEYNKAIELDANYFMGYINRGSAYAKSGKENKAMIDYNNVIEINQIVYSLNCHSYIYSKSFTIARKLFEAFLYL